MILTTVFTTIAGRLMPYLMPALGAALVFVALIAAGQTWRLDRAQAKVIETQRLWDAERVRMQAAAIKAMDDNAKETARRLKAYQEASDASEIRTTKARADAVVAGNAAERLRKRAADLAASCGAGSGNSGAASQDAAEAGRVLADMQRRLSDFAGRVSEFADQSSNDADTCEASHQALRR